MSIWSDINGTIDIYKFKHVSLHAIIVEVFDDYVKHIEQINEDTYWKYQLTLSFEDDGDTAYKKFKNFLSKLDEHSATYDLVLSVRYLN
jgi:hypothetical protein